MRPAAHNSKWFKSTPLQRLEERSWKIGPTPRGMDWRIWKQSIARTIKDRYRPAEKRGEGGEDIFQNGRTGCVEENYAWPGEISCVNGTLCTWEVSCVVVLCVKSKYTWCMGRTKPTISADYVVGLTDGEGCFHVNLGVFPAYTSGVRVQMHFHLKMQERDRQLLENVRDVLDCGKVYFQKEKRTNHCQCYRYTVYSQRDILTKIIPFFQKHPLRSTSKQESFETFCAIGKLVEAQAHFSKSGIKKIKLLKSKMNRRTVGLA